MESLLAACVWAVAANVIAMIPSRARHWPQAKVLIATGLPVLAWVVWQNGALIGLAVALAGAWVLRWPLRFFWAWLWRCGGRA